MTALTLILFIVSTTVHLCASLKKNTKWRNLTKPFLLLTLLGFYLSTASEIRSYIVLALLFSWLGDLLLMPKGVKWFTAGGIAFMISHVFFILGYCQDIFPPRISLWVIAGFELVFFVIVWFVFQGLKPHLSKALFYPMFFYLLINGTMNCFAILRMLNLPCAATVTTFVGAALFFVSDSSLFFVRFKKDSRLKTHFLIMLTYSLGELLIIIGLL